MSWLLLSLTVAACAAERADGLDIEGFAPDTPDLAERLRITPASLAELRHQAAQRHGEFYVIAWERNGILGEIGVWMAAREDAPAPRSGPVYFWFRHGNTWQESQEMSMWGFGR